MYTLWNLRCNNSREWRPSIIDSREDTRKPLHLFITPYMYVYNAFYILELGIFTLNFFYVYIVLHWRHLFLTCESKLLLLVFKSIWNFLRIQYKANSYLEFLKTPNNLLITICELEPNRSLQERGVPSGIIGKHAYSF